MMKKKHQDEATVKAEKCISVLLSQVAVELGWKPGQDRSPYSELLSPLDMLLNELKVSLCYIFEYDAEQRVSVRETEVTE